MNPVYGWLTEASSGQKRALLAAFLGFMLDSMDVMLYALVLGQVQRDLHLSAALSGGMMSATLVAAAFGGMIFGWFADRFGRVHALICSVLVYSIATALCGFTQTAAQLLICRVFLGLGMGGEWAAGAALVAETWPARHRGKALALVQSAWAVGYAAGAAVVGLVMPRFGWRAVFFAGILPALISLWVRRGLREPEIWRQERSSQLFPSQLFRGRVRLQHAGLLDHERCLALRLVGALHLATPVSFHVCSRGRPRPRHSANLGMDDCHADGHIPGLYRLRLSG